MKWLEAGHSLQIKECLTSNYFNNRAYRSEGSTPGVTLRRVLRFDEG